MLAIFNIYLLKNKYLLAYIFFLLNNIKYWRLLVLKQLKFLVFITNIFNSTFPIISQNHYLAQLYNNMGYRCFFLNNNLYLLEKNSYFFWYFFNQDTLIQLFINILVRDGKKNISYKTVYKSLFFFKKLCGIHPIYFLKKSLYKNRFLFDIQYVTLKTKVLTLPKMLSAKSQIMKSFKYILNFLHLKKWRVNKKHTSFYKKVTYLLFYHFFDSNRFNKIIHSDSIKIKNNFHSIKKEESFLKYVTTYSEQFKKPSFKLKKRSLDKKIKSIKRYAYKIRMLKNTVDISKILFLDRYKVNVLSKCKIKTKWFY